MRGDTIHIVQPVIEDAAIQTLVPISHENPHEIGFLIPFNSLDQECMGQSLWSSLPTVAS